MLFSTSVELDLQNVRPSVRPTKPTMIFVLQVHFDGEFMYLKSFWLKKRFLAIFGVL